MAERANSSEDRYAHLRDYALRQKQATVDRLKQAITQLEKEARAVTTFTIKEISGLDYMAYYRNAEALAIFRAHSTHLRKQHAMAQMKRRRVTRSPSGEQEIIVPSRDPLLHYKKPRLVAELRAARAKHDQMEQQYQALLQEHMDCGLAIARLQTQLGSASSFSGAVPLILAKRGTWTTKLAKNKLPVCPIGHDCSRQTGITSLRKLNGGGKIDS